VVDLEAAGVSYIEDAAEMQERAGEVIRRIQEGWFRIGKTQTQGT